MEILLILFMAYIQFMLVMVGITMPLVYNFEFLSDYHYEEFDNQQGRIPAITISLCVIILRVWAHFGLLTFTVFVYFTPTNPKIGVFFSDWNYTGFFQGFIVSILYSIACLSITVFIIFRCLLFKTSLPWRLAHQMIAFCVIEIIVFFIFLFFADEFKLY